MYCHICTLIHPFYFVYFRFFSASSQRKGGSMRIWCISKANNAQKVRKLTGILVHVRYKMCAYAMEPRRAHQEYRRGRAGISNRERAVQPAGPPNWVIEARCLFQVKNAERRWRGTQIRQSRWLRKRQRVWGAKSGRTISIAVRIGTQLWWATAFGYYAAEGSLMH